MADNTSIEWADATWNPIRARVRQDMAIRGRDVPAGTWGYHCERISPGCVNCYASTMNGRMLPAWGTGLDFTVPNREKLEIFLDEEELLKPLKWKKPRRIFVESMSDWCATFVTDEMRDRILAVAALCPQHTFLFLTKRAKECAEYLEPGMRPARERIYNIAYGLSAIHDRGIRIDLANAHIGFSAENQECFDARWSHMRRLAAVGWKVWVSAEPLLGPIDLRIPLGANGPSEYPVEFEKWPEGRRDEWFKMQARATYISRSNSLHQVVVGGESGHGARPMNVDWVRSIVRQCRDAGVACFVKQLGAKPEGWLSPTLKLTPGMPIYLKDRKGGKPLEWPEDLRVRQFPEAPHGTVGTPTNTATSPININTL